MGEILKNIRSKLPNLRTTVPEPEEQMKTQLSTTERLEAVGDAT